jgi:hypothetical protein
MGSPSIFRFQSLQRTAAQFFEELPRALQNEFHMGHVPYMSNQTFPCIKLSMLQLQIEMSFTWADLHPALYLQHHQVPQSPDL